jgi:CheY-like chemotaxis protein
VPTSPMIVLLAEDDDGHANLVHRNLRRSGIVNEIVRVRNGQEAIDYIRRQGPFCDRISGGSLLLLVDINMPGLSGIDVLREIKNNEATNKIPVIMLTTTDDPREVELCYELGCSVYITKPVEYEAFVEAIKRLGMFLQIVNVPPEEQK